MTNDEALDREFAYTDYRESCRDLYSIEQLCRRPRGHTGDHASGFGSRRVWWANEGESA